MGMWRKWLLSFPDKESILNWMSGQDGRTHGGARKSLGVEIMDVPWGWTEFVMNFEPAIENDVWGEVRL